MLSFICAINIDKIMCGQSSLNHNGLTSYNSHLEFETDCLQYDGFNMVYITYWYFPEIDFAYTSPHKDNPHVFVPTRERALVDYIRCEKHCDEGVLIEALHDYLNWFYDLPKLYEVADYFKVPRKTIDYWLEEARNDFEV